MDFKVITFKQFLSEGTNIRKGDVLYTSPQEYLIWSAQRHHEELEKLARDLGISKHFKDQKLHVSVYRVRNEPTYQMEISIPIPDGMDADELKFFIDVAQTTMKNRFKLMNVQFKNKSRNYVNSAEDFISSVDNRRNKKQTDGDMMLVNAEIEGWHENK